MIKHPPGMTAENRRRVRLERTYQAPIEDVWELWTTKEGIESWWGPGGFRVTVSFPPGRRARLLRTGSRSPRPRAAFA